MDSEGAAAVLSVEELAAELTALAARVRAELRGAQGEGGAPPLPPPQQQLLLHCHHHHHRQQQPSVPVGHVAAAIGGDEWPGRCWIF